MKKSTLITKSLLTVAGSFSILGYGLEVNAAKLTPVDIELAFLIDASKSISDQDFYGQINALNNIFNDPNFYNDFVLPLGQNPNHDPNIDPSLAIAVYQFGTEVDATGRNKAIVEQIVDWTVYNEENQSGIGQLQANTIEKIGGFTPIGDALDVVVKDLLNNDYQGKMTINFSGDAFDTFSTISYLKASQNAFRKDVTINALAISADPGLAEAAGFEEGDPRYNLSALQTIVDPYSSIPDQHKKKNFDGDPTFVMLDYVKGNSTLEDALRLKFAEETTGKLPPPKKEESQIEKVPEPSSFLGLLVISLLGLLGQQKKR
ncbi:MAG: DUF1194 domain-containing protein [Crocosphaera sp.]|jgi:hypothetical protein